MDDPDYRAISERISSLTTTSDDVRAVLGLLGHEWRQTNEPESFGIVAIAPGRKLWSTAPRLDSADDFEKWALAREETRLDDCGYDPVGGTYYFSCYDPKFGNDYGSSTRMGAAMWAAFVRLIGRVIDDE